MRSVRVLAWSVLSALAIVAASLQGLVGTTSSAAASAGDLDSSFGTGGKVTAQVGGYYSFANATAVQSDGKIVVVGGQQPLSGGCCYEFAIARYTSAGALDASFGTGGRLITRASPFTNDYANAVAIQSDGKIVVGGYSNGRLGLVRLNTDGSLDSTFGTGGKVYTPFTSGFGIINGAGHPAGRIHRGRRPVLRLRPLALRLRRCAVHVHGSARRHVRRRDRPAVDGGRPGRQLRVRRCPAVRRQDRRCRARAGSRQLRLHGGAVRHRRNARRDLRNGRRGHHHGRRVQRRRLERRHDRRRRADRHRRVRLLPGGRAVHARAGTTLGRLARLHVRDRRDVRDLRGTGWLGCEQRLRPVRRQDRRYRPGAGRERRLRLRRDPAHDGRRAGWHVRLGGHRLRTGHQFQRQLVRRRHPVRRQGPDSRNQHRDDRRSEPLRDDSPQDRRNGGLVVRVRRTRADGLRERRLRCRSDDPDRRQGRRGRQLHQPERTHDHRTCPLQRRRNPGHVVRLRRTGDLQQPVQQRGLHRDLRRRAAGWKAPRRGRHPHLGDPERGHASSGTR